MDSELKIGFLRKDRDFVVFVPMDDTAVIFEEFRPQYMTSMENVVPFEWLCPSPHLLGPELLTKLEACFCEMAGISLRMNNPDGFHGWMKEADKIKKFIRQVKVNGNPSKI